MIYDKQFKYWIFSMWTNWQSFRIGADWFFCYCNGQRGFQEFNIYLGPLAFGWTKYKTTNKQYIKWLWRVKHKGINDARNI